MKNRRYRGPAGTPKFYVTFGIMMASARKEKGVTLKSIAKELNVSVPTVAKAESGQHALRFDAVIKICRLLSISVNDVVSEVDSVGGGN